MLPVKYLQSSYSVRGFKLYFLDPYKGSGRVLLSARPPVVVICLSTRPVPKHGFGVGLPAFGCMRAALAMTKEKAKPFKSWDLLF